MNHLHIPFALLCLFALSGFIPATESVGMKEALDIAKEAIESLNKALDVYQMSDKDVSWSKLNKTIVQLGNQPVNFSKSAATLLGEIETKILNGMDAHYRATQNFHQWSDVTIELLERLKSLFDGEMDRNVYNTQRDILLQLLDVGITKMNSGLDGLVDVSSHFRDAADKLSELNLVLKKDFDENSEYFQRKKAEIRKAAYESVAPFTIIGHAIADGIIRGLLIPKLKADMKSTVKFFHGAEADVENAVERINQISAKLGEAIKHIGDLKLKNQSATEIDGEANATSATKEALLQSIEHLTTKCKEFRGRHKIAL